MAHQRRPDLNRLSEASDSLPAASLAGALRGDAAARASLLSLDPARVCDAARHHGIVPLLAARLDADRDTSPLATSVRNESAAHLAADLAREYELRRCVDELDRAGVSFLIIKGAHLAYTYYERPDLRPRVDTDILIDRTARDRAGHVLTVLGYERKESAGGEVRSAQVMYVKRDSGRVVHAVDVHWRVANPQVFAGVLEFEDAQRDAVPVPALGPAARGLSPVHALLVACVHRAAHHYDSDHLIWLYDIDAIARRLSPDEFVAFATLARDRGVGAVCREGLKRAAAAFGTTSPSRADLILSGIAGERTEEYLATSDRTLTRHLWVDLRALPTWSERGRLVREHLFPPVRYMRDVYAPSSKAPLAVLYARRFLLGARKWLVRF